MLIGTIHSSTRVTVFTHDLRMNVKAFVAITALREEFALLFRMHIFALSIGFVTLRPVLTSHL